MRARYSRRFPPGRSSRSRRRTQFLRPARGLLTSWATPATSEPSATSRSVSTFFWRARACSACAVRRRCIILLKRSPSTAISRLPRGDTSGTGASELGSNRSAAARMPSIGRAMLRPVRNAATTPPMMTATASSPSSIASSRDIEAVERMSSPSRTSPTSPPRIGSTTSRIRVSPLRTMTGAWSPRGRSATSPGGVEPSNELETTRPSRTMKQYATSSSSVALETSSCSVTGLFMSRGSAACRATRRAIVLPSTACSVASALRARRFPMATWTACIATTPAAASSASFTQSRSRGRRPGVFTASPPRRSPRSRRAAAAAP